KPACSASTAQRLIVSYFWTGSRTSTRSMRHPWGTKTPSFSCAATLLIVGSEESDRDADLAVELSRVRVIARAGRVVADGGPRSELHAARRKPVAQQPIPRFADLLVRAVELRNRVLAAGDHCFLVLAGAGEIRCHLNRGVVSELLGRCDTRIVEADAVAGLAVEPVRLHPRINFLHPEIGDLFAVRPDMAKVGDGGGWSVNDGDFHTSMIRGAGRRALIKLAFQLIAIADLGVPPYGRCAAESRLERASERFGRTKPNGHGYMQHWQSRLGNEPLRSHLEPAPARVVAQRLSHPCSEQAVKVKLREIG